MTVETSGENLDKLLEMKQTFLQIFITFRNDFLDDLPPKRLMPEDENYLRYKCRGNTFAGVKNGIERLIRKGVITNEEAIRKGMEFVEYVGNIDFTKFTTKENIDKLNEILDFMIEELSK